MVEPSSRVSPPARNQLLWFSPSGSRNLLPLGSNIAVMARPAPGFGESRCSTAKAKCQGTVCPRRKTKPATAINQRARMVFLRKYCIASTVLDPTTATANRSEEHTSELQSRLHLVCRLLLEKKKNDKSEPSEVLPVAAHVIGSRCT